MNYPIVGIVLFLATFNIAASNSGTSANDKEHVEVIKNVPTLNQPNISTTATPATNNTTAFPITSIVANGTAAITPAKAAVPNASTTASATVASTTMATTVTDANTSKSNPTSTTVKSHTSPNPTKPPLGPSTNPPFRDSPTMAPKGRHFDGLSFMGGIILTACVVGLSVGSYKFYKIKTEQSYLTL